MDVQHLALRTHQALALATGQPHADPGEVAALFEALEAIVSTASTLPDLLGPEIADATAARSLLADLRDVVDHLREHLEQGAEVLWSRTVPGAT